MKQVLALLTATLASCASHPAVPVNSPAPVGEFTEPSTSALNTTQTAPASMSSNTSSAETKSADNDYRQVNTTNTQEEHASDRAAPSTSAPQPASEPDNTRSNARKRNDSSLTPADQGTSAEDRRITQRIRQEVVKNSSLSFNAKNVKIITINGKVTLRGPVNNDQERSAIDAVAKKIAGEAQVENQLEIKK